MSSLDNFARASLNQALAWIMRGQRIRQGQTQIISEGSIYSADCQRGRGKLKYALQDSGLLAWGIEQGKDEYSEIPADRWTDESKIDYFNSALEFGVYCMGYSEIYVQTDELVNRFPVPESERSINPLELPDDLLAGCLPQISHFDRPSPPGEYFVVEAIEQIGKELFPNDWTGQERDIYQNGYCWIDGAFSNLLAYDTPDMLLGYGPDAVQAGGVKPYWKLFKDMPEQEYFSNLHELRYGIDPRLKKNNSLPQYAQDFIADLKDNWSEITSKAKLLKENFREVRTRWDQAFDELASRVGDNARFFDFNRGATIPIERGGWSSGMGDLYRGGLQAGLIYSDCYKTLGLPENGKWAVLVSESVLSKSDNAAAVRKNKGGASPKYAWESFNSEMAKYKSGHESPPSTQSLMERHMQQWCSRLNVDTT